MYWAVALVVLLSFITNLRRVHSAHNLSRLKRECMAGRLGWELELLSIEPEVTTISDMLS